MTGPNSSGLTMPRQPTVFEFSSALLGINERAGYIEVNLEDGSIGFLFHSEATGQVNVVLFPAPGTSET